MGINDSRLVKPLPINTSGVYPKVDNDICLPCDKIQEMVNKYGPIDKELSDTINIFCDNEKNKITDSDTHITFIMKNKIVNDRVESKGDLTISDGGMGFNFNMVQTFEKQPDENDGIVKFEISEKVMRINVNDQQCIPC